MQGAQRGVVYLILLIQTALAPVILFVLKLLQTARKSVESAKAARKTVKKLGNEQLARVSAWVQWAAEMLSQGLGGKPRNTLGRDWHKRYRTRYAPTLSLVADAKLNPKLSIVKQRWPSPEEAEANLIFAIEKLRVAYQAGKEAEKADMANLAQVIDSDRMTESRTGRRKDRGSSAKPIRTAWMAPLSPNKSKVRAALPIRAPFSPSIRVAALPFASPLTDRSRLLHIVRNPYCLPPLAHPLLHTSPVLCLPFLGGARARTTHSRLS